MRLTAWTTLAILGVYFWTFVVAGRARGIYKVNAPSMEGPLPFQSAQRVQANTLEQLPLVLTPLWMCTMFMGETWAVAGGLAWCLGRIVYALGYYKDPARREAGFVIGGLACLFLVVATVWGLAMR
jgi:glutathione S-transferase